MWIFFLSNLGLGASPAGFSGSVALYLPYEFTSVLITVANVNPFDIDPEQTTLITVGLTSAD